MILRTCGLDNLMNRVKGKKLIFFGVGGWSEVISRDYPEYGLEKQVSYIVDNNRSLCGTKKTINGVTISIRGLEKLISDAYAGIVVIITSGAYAEIYEQLTAIPELNEVECYVAIIEWASKRDLDMYTKCPMPHSFRVNSQRVIPKIIHYCWFSGDPIPEKNLKCIESWRKYCPDYEIIEWNQSNYDLSAHPYMNQAAQNRRWGSAGDYARLDIVYNHGGIYMDVDVEVIKPLDELLYNNAYIGFQNSYEVNTGSGFGAVKGSEVIKEMRDYYDGVNLINPDGTLNDIACPVHQTEVMLRYGLRLDGSFQTFNNITVYPAEVLSPKSLSTGKLWLSNNSFSIHHFDGSWACGDLRHIGAGSRQLREFYNMAVQNEIQMEG